MADRPYVIAHRGFSGRYTENTLASIRAAVRLPVDFVEVDVQQTGDGQAVVFHDLLLRRLCGMAGRISHVPLSEIRRHRPDLPTLAQALRAVRGKCRLLIELKQVHPRLVAEVIQQEKMVDQVVVFAFDRRQMVEIAEADPRLRRFGLVSDQLASSVREWGQTVEIEGIGVANKLLRSAREVRQLQRQVGQVFVWTVNQPGRMRQLADWGVDGLITNFPDRARECLHME